MEEIKKKDKYDNDTLKKLSLNDIERFFPKKAYEELINMGFNNVSDLLNCDINGELVDLFYKRHKDAHELWNVLHGTITLLKYKYLGLELQIDFNGKYDYLDKMGFSRSIKKRLRSYYSSLCLNNIFKMIEDNDYSPLYRNFTQDRVLEIISKFKIVKDYLEEKNKTTTVEDLKNLYEKLASLVEEHRILEEQIKNIQNEIQSKIKGGSHR